MPMPKVKDKLCNGSFLLRDALFSRYPQVFYNCKTEVDCTVPADELPNFDWAKNNEHVKYVCVQTYPQSAKYQLHLTLASGVQLTVRSRGGEATHRVVAVSPKEFRIYTNHHGTAWAKKETHRLLVYPGLFMRGSWRTVVTAKQLVDFAD